MDETKLATANVTLDQNDTKSIAPTHDERGKFAKGNKLAKGNPHAKRVNKLRSVILKGTTPARMRRIWNKLLDLAEAGDVLATKEVLDRCFGKSAQPMQLVGTNEGAKMPFDFAAFAAVLRSDGCTEVVPNESPDAQSVVGKEV